MTARGGKGEGRALGPRTLYAHRAKRPDEGNRARSGGLPRNSIITANTRRDGSSGALRTRRLSGVASARSRVHEGPAPCEHAEAAQPVTARPTRPAPRGPWRKGGQAAGGGGEPVGRRGADGQRSAKGREKKRLPAAVRASEAAARLPPAGFPLW